MTQPPDDRTPLDEPVQPPPDEEPAGSTAPPEGAASPEEPASAPDAPTVAWTPPGNASPEATMPDAPPPDAPPTDAPPPEAPPLSPIISADTSGQATAPVWQAPGVPPPQGPVSGGGWAIPGTPAPVVEQTGYVVGGVGARFVAWLIDSLLASLVPAALFLYVVDWTRFFRTMFGQFQFDASGRLIPNSAYTFTFPMTPDIILAYLILVGVQFLYFVGFWTSRWQATPGMIGLKMRVVDAGTGAPLTLTQAVKRWFAMGWWLSLLGIAPVLQSAVGLAQFAVNVFLFLSTAMDDRRRGFHDKFAGSQVIRSVTSGSGATIVGCLAYIVIVILLSIIVGIVLFAAMAPELQRIFDQYPRNSI